MKCFSSSRSTVAWFSLVVVLLSSADRAGAQTVRIVNCNQVVRSEKRGVAENKLWSEDFKALNPGVAWFYNWNYTNTDIPPAGVSMEFYPMAWGTSADVPTGLQTYLKQQAAHRPRYVLSINEPNYKGQAFIPPATAAAFYKKIKTITDTYKIPLVGPQMAIGSDTADSITALDPFSHTQVTYTYMVPYLNAFFYYTGATKVTATSFHSYGGLAELQWAVELMYAQYKRPVWVTEYAYWDAATPADARENLIQETDYLERTPYVQGYAWFKERDSDTNISLLQTTPGKLTALGQAYVGVPSHIADVYYRLPGILAAGKYVALNLTGIQTTATSSLLLSPTAANATADFNVQVDTAAKYKLGLLVQGTGRIQVLKGNVVLATVNSASTTMKTVATTVTLPVGAQTLRLRFSSSNLLLSSLNFAKP